jgi:hypothetical protein
MSKKRMDVNWKRETGKEDLKPAVKRYRRYLEDKGLRPSSIPMCVLHVGKYLEFSGTDTPSVETLPGSATISMTGSCPEARSTIIPSRYESTM